MNRLFIKKAAIVFTMIALFLIPACSTAATSPSASATAAFEPVLLVSDTKAAVIEFPTNQYEEIVYSDQLMKLNGWLKKAGQNVEIRFRNRSDLTEMITAGSSAGTLSAAAYAVDSAVGKWLCNDEKIMMDMTDLVKQNAPGYFTKYASLFPERLSGIPVSIYKRPLWMKPALMLQQDFEQAGGCVTTIDGFFKFLDDAIVPTAGKNVVIAEPYYLFNEWALEQGYYNIDMFNIRGWLYAALNDQKCAPVTLESIPGFKSFLSQLCAYYNKRLLSNSPNESGDAQIAGYVAPLHIYYAPQPYSVYDWAPLAKGKYTAHAFTPDLPSHMVGPYYAMELAVPATASAESAADVVHFVEWLYSSQESYDTVMYGEKGVDFSDDNGRFTPLVNGRNIGITASGQPIRFFFTWPGCNVLSNSDFCRVPSVAPANVEEVVNDGINRNPRFPLYSYLNAFEADNNEKLQAAGDVMSIADQRQQLMDNFLYSVSNALQIRNEDDIKGLIDGLSACRNEQLVKAYSEYILNYINKANSSGNSSQ